MQDHLLLNEVRWVHSRSAPDLPRRRDSATSATSSTSSFARNPPPPFFRGSSTPTGITLAGGPPPRSRSASSRASISKTALEQRESALLPSAPPETSASDNDASAPPITLDNEDPLEMPEAPQIHISQSDDSLTAVQIQSPRIDFQSRVNDDEQYLASLQSRVSAPCSVVEVPQPHESVGVLFPEKLNLKKLLHRHWMMPQKIISVYQKGLVLRILYRYIPREDKRSFMIWLNRGEEYLSFYKFIYVGILEGLECELKYILIYGSSFFLNSLMRVTSIVSPYNLKFSIRVVSSPPRLSTTKICYQVKFGGNVRLLC